jgi:hypothetical protein
MLESRSYRKELILIATHIQALPLTMSPYLHLKKMGMAHVMFMSMDEPGCAQVRGSACAATGAFPSPYLVAVSVLGLYDASSIF